jgi:uncharacterized protein YoxC
MTTVEIIFAIIALGFILLVIFGVRFLCVGCKTLNKVNETVDSVKRQLDDLGHEPRDLMHHTNEISAEILTKMKHLDPFFRAAANIGEELECKTYFYKENAFCKFISSKFRPTDECKENTVVECIEWALVGINLWKKLKQRR